MAELTVGATFGPYRIDGVLGRGGMGVVYRAYEIGLDRHVALKVIAPRLLDDEAARMRFVRETRVAASLEHPHVVPVYAAGAHDGTAFLAMRLIDGADLHALVAHGGPLAPERAVAVLAQIASALDAAHAAGLVHRDVKPANVVLGPGDHAYLTDFGIAAHARAAGGSGTPGYMAPEVEAGAPADIRAEVFSLGRVLAFMLGALPAAPLDAVVARAVAAVPAARFGSAGELAAAARAALQEDDPTVAADDGPPPLPAPLAVRPGAFVGREDAAAALTSAWREGRRLALVSGDPGIGKSRLAAEFAVTAHAEQAAVLLGRCYEEQFVPYQPFTEALGPLAAAGSGDPESERLRLFESAATLVRVAARAPAGAILVLEDLHWVDEASAQMLRHLLRVLEDAPVLVLGTCRDVELDDRHPLTRVAAEQRRARRLVEIRLEGLDRDGVAALLRDRGVEADAASLHARTQGNPYFVEELSHAQGDDLPAEVTDLIRRRTERLGEEASRVVALAAVAGAEFELAVLARAAGLSQDAVLGALEEASAARVVEEVPAQVGRFAFAHALVRETVYRGLSATRRARLHLALGEAHEAEGAAPAVLAHHFGAAAETARAFEHRVRAAEEAERRLSLEAAAGHYAAAIADGGRLGLTLERDERMRELLFARVRTINAMGVGPNPEDHRRLVDAAAAAGDRVMEMRALDELAFVVRHADMLEALRLHRRALALSEELDDRRQQVIGLSRLSLLHSNRLELDVALETAERSLALARELDDDRAVAQALDALKLVLLHIGAIRRFETVVGELEALQRAAGDDPMLVWTLQERAYGLVLAGRPEQAAHVAAEGLAIAARLGLRSARGMLLDATAAAHGASGRYDEALAAAAGAVEALGEKADLAAWPRATQGRLLHDLRSPDAGEAFAAGLAAAMRAGARGAALRCAAGLARTGQPGAYEQALRLAAQVSGPSYVIGAHAYAAIAEAQTAAGEPVRALMTLRPVLEAAAEAPWAHGPLRLAESGALLALGQAEDALAALAQAPEAAGGVPLWELRAAEAAAGAQAAS